MVPRRLALLLLALTAFPVGLAGCGGSSDPVAANYSGFWPDDTIFDLSGDVVLAIDDQGNVDGTLNGEIEPNDTNIRIRGDLDGTDFRGDLRGGFEQYFVDGTITRVGDRIRIDWIITDEDGNEDETSFDLDRL